MPLDNQFTIYIGGHGSQRRVLVYAEYNDELVHEAQEVPLDVGLKEATDAISKYERGPV